MDSQPYFFPDWKRALQDAAVPDKPAFFREIVAYLRHLKSQRRPASIRDAREYLEHLPADQQNPGRLALRWAFRISAGPRGKRWPCKS